MNRPKKPTVKKTWSRPVVRPVVSSKRFGGLFKDRTTVFDSRQGCIAAIVFCVIFIAIFVANIILNRTWFSAIFILLYGLIIANRYKRLKGFKS